MNRPITDAGVAGLDIHEGRAELLEEIMTLAPVEHPEPVPAGRRRALPVLAAVAAVLAVVAGAGWLAQLRGPQPVRDPAPAAAPSSSAPPVAASPQPVLIRAAGWTLGVDEEADSVAWTGPDGARLLAVTVGGVPDPFRYDRYLDAKRHEITVLGERALLAEWKEGGVRYRAAVLSADPTTVQVLEGTGMSRADFLDVVATAAWVTPEEYEAAVEAAAPSTQ